jgi:hypothetical protein
VSRARAEPPACWRSSTLIGQGEPMELDHHPGGDPCITAAAQGALCAGVVGDALVPQPKTRTWTSSSNTTRRGRGGGGSPADAGRFAQAAGCGAGPTRVGDPGWQHRHDGVRVGASETRILSPVPALLHPRRPQERRRLARGIPPARRARVDLTDALGADGPRGQVGGRFVTTGTGASGGQGVDLVGRIDDSHARWRRGGDADDSGAGGSV